MKSVFVCDVNVLAVAEKSRKGKIVADFCRNYEQYMLVGNNPVHDFIQKLERFCSDLDKKYPKSRGIRVSPVFNARECRIQIYGKPVNNGCPQDWMHIRLLFSRGQVEISMKGGEQ